MWVHGRAANSADQEAPEHLCAERAVYRLAESAPDPEAVEEWLQKIETLAATALRNVCRDCTLSCGIGSWRGQCPSLGGYVTVTGATDGAPAAGARSC